MKKKIVSEMTKMKLELPLGTVTIGPGTIPTSLASVSTTSIKQISSDLKELSRLKIFPHIAIK